MIRLAHIPGRLFDLVALGCLSLFLSAQANGQSLGKEALYNPQPASGDILLPMPGELEMVFVPVEVPGGDFWPKDNSGRFVALGDRGGEEIFETVSDHEIGGVFEQTGARADAWYIPFGKYEVSQAQFIAVMSCERSRDGRFVEVSCGDLETGKARLIALSADPEIEDRLGQINLSDGFGELERGDYRELAKPVHWIDTLAYAEFIDLYSLWCLQTEACREKMPKGKADDDTYKPGYFRLPDEVEWEYTLRSHDGGAAFDAPLPVPENQLSEYAWVTDPAAGKTPRSVTRIGRFKPIAGVHDLIGNVEEIMLGAFQPRISEGKVGGYALRGGSYLDQAMNVGRASFRAEAERYQYIDSAGGYQPAQLAKSGIRLVIGADVILSQSYRKALEDGHAAYRALLKERSAAVLSGGAGTGSGTARTPSRSGASGDPLSEIVSISQQVAAQSLEAGAGAEYIEEQVNQARDILLRRNKTIAERSARLAFNTSWVYGSTLSDLRSRRRLLESVEDSDSQRVRQRADGLRDQIHRSERDLNGALEQYLEYLDWLSELPDYAVEAARAHDVDTSDRLGKRIRSLLVRHVENATSGSIPRNRIEKDLKELYEDADFR